MSRHSRVLALVAGVLLISSLARATTPVHVWSRGSGDVGDDVVYDVAYDAAGNVIIVGAFSGSVNFGGGPLTSAGDQDVFVAKYFPDGSHMWSRRFGGNGVDRGHAVAVDTQGNIIITGYFAFGIDFGGGYLASYGPDEIFLVKLDSSLNHVWSKGFGSASPYPGDMGYDVCVHPTGDIIVTGSCTGADFGGGPRFSSGLADIFIARFDPSGGHMSSELLGTSEDDRGNACALDSFGNVTVAGFVGDSVNTSAAHVLLAGFSPYLALQWSRTAGGPGRDEAEALAVDVGGEIAVVGHFRSSMLNLGGQDLSNSGNNDDIFIARYTPFNTHIWSQSFGNHSTSDMARSVAIDPAGSIIVTGRFGGTVNFGGGDLVASGADIFMAAFDVSGAHQWSVRFGSPGSEDGQTVAVSTTNHLALGGSYGGTMTFGGPLTSGYGGQDACVADFSIAAPVPVLISRFNAAARGSAVEVSWSLESDEGLDGYTLYRSTSTAAPLAIVQGTNASVGSYLDQGVKRGETYRYELAVRTFAGETFRSPATTVTIPVEAASLGQNYPNPFNPRTTIEYNLDARTSAQVVIYDASGRRVRMLDGGTQDPGTHRVVWDGRDDSGNPVSSGVYFYRMAGDASAGMRKMVLLK